MGVIKGLTVTRDGQALRADAMNGVPFSFTRAAVGAGAWADEEEMRGAVALKDERVAAQRLWEERGEGSLTLSLAVDNAGIVEGFHVRELGVFAQGAQGGEVLFAVASLSEYPDYLFAPHDAGVPNSEYVYNLSFTLEDGAQVMYVSPSLAGATAALEQATEAVINRAWDASEIVYGSAGLPGVATVRQGLDAVLGTVSWVYRCTGVNDDLAVQGIVNGFIANGTAMSMSLKIVGTMGLRSSPPSNRHIALTTENTRGCSVVLDFADCVVPEVTEVNRVFLYVATSYITIKYLNAVTKHSTINSTANAGSHLTVDSCVLHSTSSAPVYLSTNQMPYSTIINCKLTGGVYGLLISNNCTVQGCEVTSINDRGLWVFGNDNYVAGCTINTNNGHGIDCQGDYNMFIGCSIHSGGTDIANLVTGVNVMKGSGRVKHITFVGCRITCAGGIGAVSAWAENTVFYNCYIKSETSRGVSIYNVCTPLTLVDCTIIGGEYALRTYVSNSSSRILLIRCRLQSNTMTYAVYQHYAAGTTQWHIEGCTFNTAGIRVNGTNDVTFMENSFVYMPQYSNRFGVTIEETT